VYGLKPVAPMNKNSVVFFTIDLIFGSNLFYQIADVKRAIENTQGSSVYPANQLMLIYQGSILKDDSTLAESKVAENSFVVIMVSKVLFFSPLFNTCQLLNQLNPCLNFTVSN
jgi:Ubiquitin family